MIYGLMATVNVNNCIFANSTSKYATAIYNDRKTYVTNSKFINLNAVESAGAIVVKELDEALIENCSFINVTSTRNAGAVFIDTPGFLYVSNGTTTIFNSEFVNCSSDFGGAVVALDGYCHIIQCTFDSNSATYDGGAIYSSFGELYVKNTLITNNKLTYDDEDFTHGGGIYSDYQYLEIYNTDFINNTKHGLYIYDSDVNVTGSLFENNGEAIHGVFLENYILNNSYVGDTDCLNDTNYASVVVENGKVLELLNDSIIFSRLPQRFDLRDWNWVSGVKDQGSMNACWAFATTGALESSLIKTTGIEYDFSENNVQNSLLRYSKYGFKLLKEGADDLSPITYVINWFGMVNTFDDTYDEVGKMSPLIGGDENIHVQDVLVIDPRKNSTDNKRIKEALLEYGALAISYNAESSEPYYNKNTSSQYYNGTARVNHAVSLVGWDDEYSASNFLITPPGDGAWIIKNSYGIEHGDQGYDYVSYYDTSLSTFTSLVGYIFENNENYTKNYQTDLGGEIKCLMATWHTKTFTPHWKTT